MNSINMNSTWNNQTFSINKYRDVGHENGQKNTPNPQKKIYYKTDTNFVKKAQQMSKDKVMQSGYNMNTGQSHSVGPNHVNHAYKHSHQEEDPEYRPKTSFNKGRIDGQDVNDKKKKKRPSKIIVF